MEIMGAMKQSLEALEAAKNNHGVMLLSDPPQDAWRFHRVSERCSIAITALRQAIEQAEQQEPVGKFAKFSDGVWKEVTEGSAGVLLYTSPPPRQPLTDEEIVSVANTVDKFGVIKQRDMNFARAIEAAHGIGEKA